MALTYDQKRYIKKHARESTLYELAKHLNLPEKEIAAYLKDQWKDDKFKKFLQRKSPEETPSFIQKIRFKDWVRTNWIQMVFLVILIVIVYANSVNGNFLSDDIAVIRDSKTIGDLNFVFSNPFEFMRPFLYFIIFSIFGKNPFWFHLMNIFFHTGVVMLIFACISLTVNPTVGFLTATLFSIHPLLSEPVAWISGGSYPQQSFFEFLSLFLLILHIRSKNNRYYILSIISAIIAFFSADKTMVLPFLLTLYLFVFTDFKKTWKKSIPYFILVSIWIIYYFLRIKTRIASVQHEQFQQNISFNPFMQIPVALSSYFELMVWPDKLSIYHSDFIMSTTVFIARVLVALTYVASLIYTFFKKRVIFFGLAFFLIALSPTLTPLGISSLLAERYSYIGTAGIFFIVAYGIWRLSTNKKYETTIYLIFMVIIGVLAIRTIMRNLDWQNEDILWLATGKTAIYDPVTHMNLGDMHRRHKNYPEAEREFKQALAISPNNAYAYYNLGLVYTEAGAYKPALEMYNNALKIDPNLWQSYQNISVVYSFMGDKQKSIENIQKAIAIVPYNSDLLTNMGLIYLDLKQNDNAKAAFTKALQMNPSDDKARSGLSQTL